LTDTLTDEKFPVTVSSDTLGVKLRGGRSTRVTYASAASAPVAQPNTATNVRPVSNVGIEGAVARASVIFVGELPANATIAVISISSNNADLATFAIDELEYQLVTARQFTIVDRKTLDTIRMEQNFQLSGEVSDQSAVSIGNLLGASIVVTGSITGSGNTQRLTLKALNVKTAQIITMARESF
jgi:curli biogenesis system outer membrane secretion channel CsgG